MQDLIGQLKAKGVLHSRSVIRALEEVDRADFLPADMKRLAYEDTALPIGEGQTISQPYTVVFMLEQLQVRPGDVILDIGYGSGWQTALLAHLAGSSGRVYALELVPILCREGKQNFGRYPHLSMRVRLICMSGQYGYAQAAPFDRIIAAAQVSKVPAAWREQLIPGGRMIYPKDGSLVLEVKDSSGVISENKFKGFVFVPFVAD